MKLKRIAAIPFALVADVVTMGKMGEGSFTQDVFDAERREQRTKEEIKCIDALAKLLRALK